MRLSTPCSRAKKTVHLKAEQMSSWKLLKHKICCCNGFTFSKTITDLRKAFFWSILRHLQGYCRIALGAKYFAKTITIAMTSFIGDSCIFLIHKQNILCKEEASVPGWYRLGGCPMDGCIVRYNDEAILSSRMVIRDTALLRSQRWWL